MARMYPKLDLVWLSIDPSRHEVSLQVTQNIGPHLSTTDTVGWLN